SQNGHTTNYTSAKNIKHKNILSSTNTESNSKNSSPEDIDKIGTNRRLSGIIFKPKTPGSSPNASSPNLNLANLFPNIDPPKISNDEIAILPSSLAKMLRSPFTQSMPVLPLSHKCPPDVTSGP